MVIRHRLASRVRPGRSRHVRRRQLGQGLTELALVTPILLLLFAGAADLGRAFYAYVAIENAVKEGAFFGASRPICDVDRPGPSCDDPGNVTWRVRNETSLANPDGSPLSPSVQCVDRATSAVYSGGSMSNCEEGDTYVVSLEYDFQLLTPILGQIVGDGLTLRSESHAIVLNRDPTPGLGVQKLVLASAATNGADVIAKCLEPDDSDATGFYRSPCRDSSNANAPLHLRFEAGDPITYKITIRNSGVIPLSGVTITDTYSWPPTSGSCPARPTSLAVGQTYTCQYVRSAPAPSGAAVEQEYINEVQADAAAASLAQDGATVIVELPPPDLRVLKFVSSFRAGGDGDGVPTFGTADTLSVFFNAQVPTPSVWYKVFVENTGGQVATDLEILDNGLPLPGGPDCPAPPSSLAAGDTYTCRYQETYNASTASPQTNTVTATSTNTPADSNDTDSASVTVQQCSGAANRVVPNLIGLQKAQAEAAWTAAGFTSGLTVWNGNPNATVVTQNRAAFSCLGQSSTMAVTRVTTP